GGGRLPVLADGVEDPDGIDAIAVPVADHRHPAGGAEGKGCVAGGAGAVAVAQVPGGGRLPVLADGVEHPDGGDAIAVPVADHRLPARGAVLEGGDVGGAGADGVLEVPGGGGGVEDADTIGAVAVPVAHQRDPARRPEGERGS